MRKRAREEDEMTSAEMRRKLLNLARGVSRNGGSLEDFEAALSTSLGEFFQDPGVIAVGIKHAYVFANEDGEIVGVEISRAEEAAP